MSPYPNIKTHTGIGIVGRVEAKDGRYKDMAQFSVKTNYIQSAKDAENRIAGELNRVESEIREISRSLGFKLAASANIRGRLNDSASSVSSHRGAVNRMSTGLVNAVNAYERAESAIISNLSGVNGHESGGHSIDGGHRAGAGGQEDSTWWDDRKDNLGNLVGAEPSAGQIAEWVENVDVLRGDVSSLGDFMKGKTDFDYLSTSATLAENLDKGILGHASDIGIADVLFKGLANIFKNIDECENGSITKERAVQEMIMETIVDLGKEVAIKAAVGAIGAKVGAAVGTVVAPGAGTAIGAVGGFLIGFAASAVSDLADVACKWVTGTVSESLTGVRVEKEVTELISDAILDYNEIKKATIELAIKTACESIKDGVTPDWNTVLNEWASIVGSVYPQFAQ